LWLGSLGSLVGALVASLISFSTLTASPLVTIEVKSPTKVGALEEALN